MRAAILNAALDSFSRDGFDGTSLPEIGKAANIGHTLIMYYFGSKVKLWRQNIEHTFGALMAEARRLKRRLGTCLLSNGCCC